MVSLRPFLFFLLLISYIGLDWIACANEVSRLQRLPDLPLAILRPGTGTCGWYSGYSQRVHDYGVADGYLRL